MATGSFIPDKPVSSNRQPRKSRRVYLLSYAVYIFFTVAVLSAIAMWLYKQYLVSELSAMQVQVQEEQQNFDSGMFDTLVSFDQKLSQASDVFYSQADVAVLLGALEEVLLTNVTLTSFSYDNTVGQAKLTLQPEFQNINDALYQREVIRDHVLFSQAEISDITMGESDAEEESTTVIEYSIMAQIDRGALRDYETAFVAPVSTSTTSTALPATTTSETISDENNDLTL